MNHLMSERCKPYTGWSLLGFLLSLSFSSSFMIQKYFGMASVPIYFALTFGVLWILYFKETIQNFLLSLSDKQIQWLFILTIMALIALFLVIYPFANLANSSSGGSDRDEALNIATIELFHGRFPYYPKNIFK